MTDAPPLTELVLRNYRSARAVDVGFDRLTVISGLNGSGKSVLFRAIALMRGAATGALSRLLADEGGLRSAAWAGPPGPKRRRGKEPARVSFEIVLDDLRYRLALGPPGPSDAALPLDPVVKEEKITAPSSRGRRPALMLSREGPHVAGKDDAGRDVALLTDLWLFETALSRLADPKRAPEAARLRERLMDIRVYEGFRVDAASPLRAPQPLAAAPNVAEDGADWAAAMHTRLAIADGYQDFDRAPAVEAVRLALDGAEPAFFEEGFSIEGGLRAPGLLRPFRARELSEGTLRFLALTACLTALRPPSVILLNEPEASLNARMVDPLAQLIASAAERSQVIVASHSQRLADLLDIEHGARRIQLEKRGGETCVL